MPATSPPTWTRRCSARAPTPSVPLMVSGPERVSPARSTLAPSRRMTSPTASFQSLERTVSLRDLGKGASGESGIAGSSLEDDVPQDGELERVRLGDRLEDDPVVED